MKKIKVGDYVYIEETKKYGIAKEIINNKVSKVEIKTTDGLEIIETLEFIVTLAKIIQVGLLPLLKGIFLEVKSWFKKK